MGCAKVGIVPALINTNLRDKAFLHSLKEVSALGCILDAEDAFELAEVLQACPNLKVYHSGDPANGHRPPTPDSINLDLELVNSSSDPVPESVEKCTNFGDKLLYIYTSGTTGMPKAAVIKHSRRVETNNLSLRYSC